MEHTWYFFETAGIKYISNRCDFTNNLAVLFVGWSFLHLRCQQPAQPSLLMFIYLCRSKRIRLNQDSLMMGRNRQRELHQAVRVGVEYYQKQQCMQAHGGIYRLRLEHHNFNLLWKTVHLLIRGYLHSKLTFSNIDSFQNKIPIFQKVVHNLSPLENKAG